MDNNKRIMLKKWRLHRGYYYLMQCLGCSKSFTISGGQYNAGTGKFHSRQCWYKYANSYRNPHWKGGRIKHNGYWYIYKPEHPYAKYDKCYVREHRLVMEKYLGRYLTPEEIVHHINGDALDNRVENLQLFSNNSSHCKHHCKIKENNPSRSAIGLGL